MAGLLDNYGGMRLSDLPMNRQPKTKGLLNMLVENPKTLAGLIADFTPVVGDVKSAYDGVQSAREGDWLGAGLGALGALPFVPNMTASVGKVAQKVSKEGPRAEAMRIAQANAAKPVSEGGLGLRPDNTPMERAKALGMEDAYHATTADIQQFDINKSSPAAAFGKGVYTEADRNKVASWAKSKDGANIMPLMVDKSRTLPMAELDAGNAEKLSAYLGRPINEGAAVPYFSLEKRGGSVSEGAGLAGFSGVDHAGPGGHGLNTVFIDPSAIRSRFAAFDPARRHEADLLGFADPRLLGGMTLGGLLGLGAYGGQE